ncbi:CcmD family protein [Sphingobacterium corticibacterium]|uniref:CcmD family protein n=1 Tax=Sphingobacterium corticibacterium TaxID=2484746 RepID=A0A4Q6XK30_9SPHI|nr:CcmD family protein [Sphingobacterium corticibacterium]RZF59735.1 CcmD family protein [Sphingobacterium corticibacterium]
MKKIITILLLFFLTSSYTFAQSQIEMATALRSSGKIYVVVLVLLTIFIVLGIFLFMLDRRIKKLEK